MSNEYFFRGGYVEDPAGDRWWSADLLKKVEAERDKARAEVERRDREHEALVETAQKALAYVTAERDEARAEVERLRDAGTVLVRSLERMTAERDKLSSERRQLRARLVECRPWVGVLPYPNTPEFSEMLAIRDLADDTLEEVQP